MPTKKERSLSAHAAGYAALTHPKPMSEADFALALAICRIVRQHGSIGAFYDHLSAERIRKDRERYDEQMRALEAA